MEKDFLQLVVRIITVIGIGFLLFFLASCYNQKIAYRQTAKADYYYPQVVQEFCHDTVVTKVIKGDTVTITKEGEKIDCDTVTVYKTINGKGKIIDCPPQMISIVTDTFFVEDTDKLKSAERNLSQCKEGKDKVQGQKKTLTNGLIASAILNLLLACCCGLLLRLKKLL